MVQSKVAVGIAVAVAVGIVAIVFGLGVMNKGVTNEEATASTNKQDSTEITPTATNPNSSNDSDLKQVELASLLPTREDIGTEWIIRPVNTNVSTFEIGSLEGKYPITGYAEAVQQLFLNNEIKMKLTLYAYESEEKAVSVFDELASKLRQDGGFEEVDVISIPAKCYGTERLFGMIWYRIDNYCTISNAIFHVQSFPAVEEDATIFSKAVANKFAQ